MYINREGGKITGVYAQKQYEGQERLDSDDPELQAFLNPTPTEQEIALKELKATESAKEIARKLEDMFEHIINDKPLPINPETNEPYAAEWVEARKAKRANIS